MLKVLDLDPRIKTVLAGDKEKAVKEIELGCPENLFVSTDLSKATDLISHEVAWALWHGILDSTMVTR
jgi:hypothetical protein